MRTIITLIEGADSCDKFACSSSSIILYVVFFFSHNIANKIDGFLNELYKNLYSPRHITENIYKYKNPKDLFKRLNIIINYQIY